MQGYRPKVGMIGAGRFGLSLAEVVARNGHEVVLLTSLPERARELRRTRRLPSVVPELERLHDRVQISTDPTELSEQCGLSLMTVSAEYIDRTLESLGAVLDGAHFVVHAVHTLEGQDLRRMSQRIQDATAVKQVGVAAGPTHVSEMLSGRPNACEVGSAYPAVIRAVQSALGCANIRVYANTDMMGVELAAALGQIVAIAVGIADGLEMGAATHATLLTRGLNEIANVGTRFGATERTFAGLSGVGRLVDAVRRGEPNYQLGLDIGTSKDPVAVVRAAPPDAQGIGVVRHVNRFAGYHGASVPICDALGRVFDGEWTPSEAMRRLMQLDRMA